MSFFPALLPLAQAGEALDLLRGGPRLALLLGVYGALLAGGLLAGALVLARLARHPPDWEARCRDLAARPLSARFGLLYALALLILWAAGAVLALLARRWAPPDADDSMGSLIHGLCFQVFGLLALALYLRARGLPWGSAFGAGAGSPLRQAGLAAVFYLAAMPVVIVTGLLYQLLLLWFGYPLELQDVVNIFARGLPPPALAAMLVLALVMAPVFEEAVFRGVGLTLLARRLGLAPAIVLTSLLFAAAHLHPPSLVPLFVLAVSFSLAYVATGSLVTPMVMHALFNGVSLGVLWLVTAE